MDRILVKRRLLEKGNRLIDLSRETGVAYDRLVRIVHGYRTPKREEIESIAEALGVSAGCLCEDSRTD